MIPVIASAACGTNAKGIREVQIASHNRDSSITAVPFACRSFLKRGEAGRGKNSAKEMGATVTGSGIQ